MIAVIAQLCDILEQGMLLHPADGKDGPKGLEHTIYIP